MNGKQLINFFVKEFEDNVDIKQTIRFISKQSNCGLYLAHGIVGVVKEELYCFVQLKDVDWQKAVFTNELKQDVTNYLKALQRFIFLVRWLYK